LTFPRKCRFSSWSPRNLRRHIRNCVTLFSFNCSLIDRCIWILIYSFDFFQAVIDKLKVNNISCLHVEIQILILVVIYTLRFKQLFIDDWLLFLCLLEQLLKFFRFLSSLINTIDKPDDISCFHCWHRNRFLQFSILFPSLLQFSDWSHKRLSFWLGSWISWSHSHSSVWTLTGQTR